MIHYSRSGVYASVKQTLLMPISWPHWLRLPNDRWRANPTVVPYVRSWWRTATWWPSESTEAVQSSLLRILSFAHRERIAVSPLVTNFAFELRGLRRFRYKRFAKRITSGMAWIDAAEQTPGILDEDLTLSLRFATQTGTLTQVYDRLLQHLLKPQGHFRLTALRLMAFNLIFLQIFAFLALFIFSTYDKLLKDLGASKPIAFDILLKVSSFIPPFMALAIIALGLWLLVTMSAKCRRYVNKVRFAVQSRLGLRSNSAQVLHLLAISLEAGRPIEGALSTLARHHFDRNARTKLLYVRNEIELGAEVWTSLQQASFISSLEADAVRLCPGTRSQSWLLHQLADKRELASGKQRTRLGFIAYSLTLLISSLLVLLIGVAHFQILRQIMGVTGF